MIYLDSASTTKIAPEVLSAMMPYLTEEYGNAGTLYSLGRRAAAAVQKAREQTARLFGCEFSHSYVIFTSGGSESNNTVFKGVRQSLSERGRRHLIVSAVEHDSVLKAAQSLAQSGFSVTYVEPDSSGVIQPREVEKAIREDTGLVSVMYVNNETGAVNDIHSIGQICRDHSILFHTDCVQAAGQYSLDVENNCVDFASISSHKIHGPKGVGALYIRNPNILPLVCGGKEQEFGLRGGTENVAGIVGLGYACERAVEGLQENMITVSTLKQRFYAKLIEKLGAFGVGREYVHVNGRPVMESGKVLNIRFDGVDSETLLIMLNTQDICVSAGSACNSRESQPSHVLIAMGLSEDEARSSIRVSFSKYNTSEEVEAAAHMVASCVFCLRTFPVEDSEVKAFAEGYCEQR